ncbi:MAG TPA: GNAT family N-acetyltransferase [Anaerolineales bacterium]|nr:GNAT family N-acetyltransferase [Anaerolineales bacterium]
MENRLSRGRLSSSLYVDGSSIMRIDLRIVAESDHDFLFSVYASTRADEMNLVDWSDEQKDAFLHMQFDAQTKHYSLYYPNAEYKIIERAGVPIGRLIVENRGDHFLIMDIALLPEYQRSGIGTFLIQELKHEATLLNLSLVLRVEFFNPAVRLYQRLGFVKTRDVNTVYQEMVWTPRSN